MRAPGNGDEGRHRAGRGAWEESWDFTFHTEGAELGGYLRIALHPGSGRAWCWAALVGRRRPLLSVVDSTVALPRGRGLDLRAEGLWAVAELETPMEHWTVGLEAFGVELDDPSEAWRSCRGDRAALGFDLEWETTGPAVALAAGEGYHLPCQVHGEVLVGDGTSTVAGWGGRSHAWGERRWWDRSWCATSGRFADGSTWYAEDAGAGERASGTLPPPATLQIGERMEVEVRPLLHAPVRVDGQGGLTSELARALCLATATDGRTGMGWTEWNRPAGTNRPVSTSDG